jgi:hypothetical protein
VGAGEKLPVPHACATDAKAPGVRVGPFDLVGRQRFSDCRSARRSRREAPYANDRPRISDAWAAIFVCTSWLECHLNLIARLKRTRRLG